MKVFLTIALSMLSTALPAAAERSRVPAAAAAPVAVPEPMEWRSFKRGFCAGGMTQADYAALSPGTSWFYDWGILPPDGEGQDFGSFGLDFCPMVWNDNYSVTTLESIWNKYGDNIRYVLGYNEPNLTDQAHMTPEEAAADWPRFQEWAKSRGLKIVAPAVNWSGWMEYNDPVVWLERFFDLLPDKGEGIDYLACHFYMPDGNAVMGNIDRLKKFGKPIWLTEFCAATSSISNDAQTQLHYLLDILPKLERDPMVYRYSWFMARTGNASLDAIDLLSDATGGNRLTRLGAAYTYLWSFPEDYYHPADEAFGATEFYSMNGGEVDFNTDPAPAARRYRIVLTGLGDGEGNEYVEYPVEFKEDGCYSLNLRCSVASSGSVEIYLDGRLLKREAVGPSGESGEWGDLTIENIQIPGAAKGILRIVPSEEMALESLRFEPSGDSGLEAVADEMKKFSVEGRNILDADIVYSASGIVSASRDLLPGLYIVDRGGRKAKVLIK